MGSGYKKITNVTVKQMQLLPDKNKDKFYSQLQRKSSDIKLVMPEIPN